MTDKQIAAEIQKFYPKHGPAAYSLAKNSEETGVMFVPKAQRIKNIFDPSVEPVKKPKPRRIKSVEFRARLTQEAAEAVKRKMAEHGIGSKQELVETLLLLWEKEKAPAAATAETNS